MTPTDLVAYLIARLRWSIARSDDIGKVVRVRTFVAIRHWLLNYFGDDFVPSLTLRQKFVDALNDVSKTVLIGGSQSDIKIVGELKKCWRRTCALYWDERENSSGLDASVEHEIYPGGPPGERSHNDNMGQRFPLYPPAARPSTSLHLLGVPPMSSTRAQLQLSKFEGAETQSKGFENGKGVNNGKFYAMNFEQKALAKAASDASINTSSLPPAKGSKKAVSAALMLGGLSGSKSSQKAVASTDNQPSASMKRSRPTGHKRSGSFSDALRDNRQPLPLQNSLARSTRVLMAFPYAGSSLVRGTLLPPTAAYVEVIAPSTPTPEAGMYVSNSSSIASSSTGIHDSYDSVGHHHRLGLGGPGMKKFLESLKKALSGKGHPNIYTSSGIHSPVPLSKHGNGSNDSDLMPDSLSRYVAANCVRNSISSGSRTSGRVWAGSVDGKAARIDLLGAGVVDAFQRVIQEEGISREISDDRQGTGRSRSTRSRLPLRRATVDTTTIGESAPSEYDEKSLVVENFPLSPQTRRRGNTIRGVPNIAGLNVVKERKGATILGPESPMANIYIEDFGFKGTGHSQSDDASTPPQTPKAPKETGLLHSKMSGHVSADSSLSSATKPSTSRHSFNRYTSHGDEFSDVGSIFGPSEEVAKALPNKLLRRRPGGNLRAATNVTDLEVPPRPNSTGSFSTFSKATSVGSFNPQQVSVMTFGNSRKDYNPRPQHLAAGVVSLGAVAKGGGVQFPADKGDDTEQSPTTAKELFEQGVMKLAALADNESDDGGIEVALMKLEGRYDRRQSKSLNLDTRPLSGKEDPLPEPCSVADGNQRHSETGSLHSLPIVEGAHQDLDISFNDGGRSNDLRARFKRRHKKVVDQVPLETPPAFNSSASSFGFPPADEEVDEVDPIIRQFKFPGPKDNITEKAQYPPRSGSNHKPEKSTISMSPRQTITLAPSTTGEDNDNMSELSSEVSFEMVSRSQSLKNNPHFKFPKPTVIAELGISSHPLRHPPSPPLTLEQALGMNPDVGDGFYQQPSGTPEHDAFPWTSIHNISSPDSTPRQRRKIRDSISLLQPPSIHLPFILAYDSELLAKQFTLIEKDALNEIDWKELVELRWKQTSTSVRDWVEFLKSKNVRGVELIIARFNLVRAVKFSLSIVVLIISCRCGSGLCPRLL